MEWCIWFLEVLEVLSKLNEYFLFLFINHRITFRVNVALLIFSQLLICHLYTVIPN